MSGLIQTNVPAATAPAADTHTNADALAIHDAYNATPSLQQPPGRTANHTALGELEWCIA